MKIIVCLIILVSLIFLTAISSLQIALSYTEEYVKEYGDNIFKNQIKFSSKTQSIVSFRLSREIYKIPFYINMLNLLHDKIIEGKVILNNNNRPSIANSILLYQSKLTPELTELAFKNKLFINSWQLNEYLSNQSYKIQSRIQSFLLQQIITAQTIETFKFYFQNKNQKDKSNFVNNNPIQLYKQVLAEYTQGQEILYHLTRLIPFLNIIKYQSRQNISNVLTISYQQINIATSLQGIVLTNFVNSSLSSKLDSNNCYKGLSDYDPRCRFFYLNSLNHTSIYMNEPKKSLAAVPSYLSQQTCQMAKFYNKKTNKIENSHVQCIEAMLSNINDYFKNIIQSSKQYYVIDPRSLSIFFNSKKQYDYSNNTQAENFYNVELEYLQDQEQAKQILTFIQKNYSDWVFSKINDSQVNLIQMFDLSQKIHVIDYKRNGTTYKAIFNPVIQYDQIPQVITKYTSEQGLQLQYAYLQINIISDEDLKAQTTVLLNFFYNFFTGMQIGLAIISVIFIIIAIFLAFKIQYLITFPFIRMKEILEEINELKEFVEISQIIKKCEENSQSIFLSKETTLLYQSFLDLFEMIQYTSESYFFENEGRTLISLSKKADFFKKFKNYSATGVTHNNIGNILLNQQHFFQALEHFSLAIMYAKYEISAYQSNNPDSQFSDLLNQYSYAEQVSNIDQNSIKSHQKRSLSQNIIKSKAILSKQEQLQNENKLTNQNVLEFTKLSNNQRKISLSSKFLTQRNSRKISKDTKSKIEETSEQSKIIQSIKKLRQKHNNNLLSSKQSNIFLNQSEDKNQVQELILNLFYRQSNYISTLIAFQESQQNLDSVYKQQKGLVSFNFWKEIKYLAKIQLNIINYFSELQYFKVIINCIISKCYYNQSKLLKAKLKFQEVESILINLEPFYNEQKTVDIQSSNSPQQKDLITDSIKKSQFQYKQFTEIDQQQSDYSAYRSINNNQNIKQQQIHFKSSYINSDLVNSVFLNFQFQQNQIPENQNSLDISCRLLNKGSNYDHCRLYDKSNTPINIKNSLTSQQYKLKNLQQGEKKIQILPLQILKQHLQFCKAEYFIFVKKLKKAAEILTNLLENSQTMSSNIPFRIICRLKQIFDAHKIQDLKLYEEYSRFNRNIFFHIILSLELNSDLNQINYDQLNLSIQKSQENSIFISKQKEFCQNQINFFQDLSDQVLTKERDEISLIIIDKEEQIINKKFELIDFKLFKSLKNNFINDTMNQSIMSQFLTKRIAQDSNLYKQKSRDSIYLEFKQLDKSEMYNEFQIQEGHLIDEYDQNILKKQYKKVLITDLNQPQLISSCHQEIRSSNYLNYFYQQQNNYSEAQKFQKNLQIFQKDQQIVNNFDQKMNVNEFLNDFDVQLSQYFKNIWPKKDKEQIEIANYYFYVQIRKSIDQLLSSQFTYKTSEDNFYIKKNQMNQNLELYKQFFSEELNYLEYDKAFKFVIYQTQICLVIKDSLFMKLCNILVKFNIQIILLLNEKGNNFLELSQNQTFTYQSKEVIKIFYSYKDIIQYLIFKRDKYSKNSYYSFIQYY